MDQKLLLTILKFLGYSGDIIPKTIHGSMIIKRKRTYNQIGLYGFLCQSKIKYIIHCEIGLLRVRRMR